MNTSKRKAEWKVVSATIVGDDHLQSGKENEDYVACSVIDGNVFVGVLADGAGSATMGAIGARIAVETILASLTDRSCQPLPGLYGTDAIIEAVNSARAAAERDATANNLSLRDYHATIVGVVAIADYGFLFHIGDGGAGAISANGNLTTSRPAESEFSDQTYFYTEEKWRENLRITLIDSPRTILLASDGCTPFMLESGNTTLAMGFVNALSNTLRCSSTESGASILLNILNSEKVRRINGDDKSLIWADLTD